MKSYLVQIESPDVSGEALRDAATGDGVWGGMHHTTDATSPADWGGRMDAHNADEALERLEKIARAAGAREATVSVLRQFEE